MLHHYHLFFWPLVYFFLFHLTLVSCSNNLSKVVSVLFSFFISKICGERERGVFFFNYFVSVPFLMGGLWFLLSALCESLSLGQGVLLNCISVCQCLPRKAWDLLSVLSLTVGNLVSLLSLMVLFLPCITSVIYPFSFLAASLFLSFWPFMPYLIMVLSVKINVNIREKSSL